MTTRLMRKASAVLLGAAIAAASGTASAYTLIDNDSIQLNADLELIIGHFSSQERYSPSAQRSPAWTEAYAKYGLSGSQALSEDRSLFGAVNVLSSGTWGDGDALGTSTGDERKTEIEDLYLGYRSSQLELSVGRQNLTIGDGFILNGDSLNLGKGFGNELNRGGAYWLAARKAFDKTVVLRAGGDSGLRGDLFWLESDNAAQSEMELAGLNVEYINEKGTFAALYLEGLGIADGGDANRDGQKTFSLRYQGNAGVENLFLSTEIVRQEAGSSGDKHNAWYGEAGWTFSDLNGSPSISYRFTRYDTGYDPLFFGFNRGYGTWFQGEVAANYAGPFGTDADIHYLGLKAQPSETLTVGASWFDFRNTENGSGSNDAQEINLWAEWVANDHLIISPLLGFYTPDSATSNQGNDDTNTYFQILAIVPF
ncbi:MAG: alginate export family protein [Marinobacterium sp.]|nr:alginate export family protein [Marinobacterium sp.]